MAQLWTLPISLHALVESLTCFDHRATRADLPANGIDFSFERGEREIVGGERFERIVRVGGPD